VYDHEKVGSRPELQHTLDAFQQVLADCVLLDLGFNGYDFTWLNGHNGAASVEGSLDRMCADVEWIGLFRSYKLTHLDEQVFDHLPHLVETNPIQ